MNVIGIFKKEISHSLDDKWFIVFVLLTMLLTPLIVMSVMGNTFQEVVSDLDIIVLTDDSSEYSNAVVRAIGYSGNFNIIEFDGNLDMAIDRVGRDVVALFYISESFGNSLSDGKRSEIFLYLDSSDFIIFNFVRSKTDDILEDSVQGVVQIIVRELEIDKSDKDAINLEVENLADSLYFEIGKVEDGLDSVDFDSVMNDFDELKEKIDKIKDGCSNCSASSINSINIQIDSIRGALSDFEGDISKVETSLEKSKEMSSSIQGKIDNLKFDLKTLKNEFLSNPIETREYYVFGNTNYFAYLLPAIISASLFFVVFTLTILNRIRRKKVKKKVKKIVRLNILLMKSLIYILIGSFELVYILILAKLMFHASVFLTPLPIFVVLILLAISSIGLGLVFSFIFKTERQTILLFPLIILPIILISETFSSLEILPEIFGKLALASPLYYSNLALREIMLKGSDLYDLVFPVGALITYSIISITIGLIILLFRKK